MKNAVLPREKGGKHHQLSNEKGGENVEPNSREFYKQCAFQKFCNTVLHNEACDTHRELRRHKAKEVTFSDMTLDEARQLHTFDEYFKREAAETVFEKAGKKITPKLLLEAIRTLPEEKRKAILELKSALSAMRICSMVASSTPHSRSSFSSASFQIRHFLSSRPWLYAILTSSNQN